MQYHVHLEEREGAAFPVRCKFYCVSFILLTWCRAFELRWIVWSNLKATNKCRLDCRIECHYTQHLSSTKELNSEIGQINFHQSVSHSRCSLIDIKAPNWTTVSDYKPVVMSPAYYCGKKKSKRVGRPPGGHSNLEGGVKRRGRRRKRRKQLFVHKKRRSSASVDNTPAGSPQVPLPHIVLKYSECFEFLFDCLNELLVVACGSQGSGEEEDLDEEDSLSEDSGSELPDDLQEDSEQSFGKSQPTTPSPSPPATPRPTRRRRKPRSPSFSDDENRPPSPKVYSIFFSDWTCVW